MADTQQTDLQGASSQAPAAATPSAPATGQDLSTAAGVSTGQPSAGAQAGGAGVSQQQQSIRDILSGAGISLQATDDQGALQQLKQNWQQYQQLQQLAPYAQEYAQNRQQYDAWRRQQAEQQRRLQQQPQQNKPWHQAYWNPPEYDPGWEKMVRRAEDGSLQPTPGAPYGVVEKLSTYRNWLSGQAEKFWQNPVEFLAPAMSQIAAAQAQQIAQQQVAQIQEQSFSKDFVDTNSYWLFQQDNSGQFAYQNVFNPQTGGWTAQKQLTPWGARFRDLVVEESNHQQRYGYHDLPQQQQRAMERVQYEYALALLQQGRQQQAPQAQQPAQEPQTPRQEANSAFLQGSSGQRPARAQRSVEPPSQPRVSLGDRLRNGFRANGITDQTLMK